MQENTKYHEQILLLANSINQSYAVNNKFYELWMTQQLNYPQLAIFSVNFYYHVAPTVDRIIAALFRVTDIEARKNLVENIADEIGLHGKAHTELLSIFLNTLLSKSAGKSVELTQISTNVQTQATEDLIKKGAELFFHADYEVGCGALLAQEWHAYPQLVKLYEGARNYKHLFELEEFHEICEYFYIHIGAAEKRHKEQSIIINTRAIRTGAAFEKLKFGFDTYVQLLTNYWQALYESIQHVGENEKQYWETAVAA